MSHPSTPVGLPNLPLPLVFGPIRPELNADTIAFSGPLVPLPLVQLALPDIFEFIYVNYLVLLGDG